jgi:hypothetical protein
VSQEPKTRLWVVEADESGYVDPGELAEMSVKVATVVEMVGGVATIGGDRVQRDDGLWVTRTVVYRWQSFVPDQKAEPEPVAAE